MAFLSGLSSLACLWDRDDAPEKVLAGPPFEVVWSIDGNWSGIALHPGGAALHGSRSGTLVAVNLRDGAATDSGRPVAGVLRMGTHKGQPMLVSFGSWGDRVSAYTTAGEPLWTHESAGAIDDVWEADLDGDGDSETVVGMNGASGLAVLDRDGKVSWTNRTIGNVWHVTAGPLDQKTVRVLTTSAKGAVHVFSVTGERVKDLNAGCYATEIRFGDQPFVGGSGNTGSVVRTLDPSGWMTKVSERTAGTHSLAAEPGVPWVAISTVTGNVYALDASTGAVAGVLSGQGRGAELAWGMIDRSPVLFVAGETGLRAYRVKTAK
jgi:hypothetical protein